MVINYIFKNYVIVVLYKMEDYFCLKELSIVFFFEGNIEVLSYNKV